MKDLLQKRQIDRCSLENQTRHRRRPEPTVRKQRLVNADRIWERALKAWKTWPRASVMNAIVVAWRKPSPSVPCQRMPMPKTRRVTPVSNSPCQTIRPTNRRVSRDSCGSRGRRFITSGADGSSARAKAGKMSVIKLSHKIWRATSGSEPDSEGMDVAVLIKQAERVALLQNLHVVIGQRGGDDDATVIIPRIDVFHDCHGETSSAL